MRYLNVPMIRQESSMSCWHAAARMIWAYKFHQSINPLPAAYAANTGISPAQFVALARTLGLQTVPEITMSYSWSAVAELLRRYGPLWVAGYWYGFPHIIVVTGAEPDGSLYVNDPGSGPRLHDMAFFNQKIAATVSNPIMFLPDSPPATQGAATMTH